MSAGWLGTVHAAGHPLITHAVGTCAVEVQLGRLLGLSLAGIEGRHSLVLGGGGTRQQHTQGQSQD